MDWGFLKKVKREEEMTECIEVQRILGWKNSSSQDSSDRWACRLHSCLWKYKSNIREHRCKLLHINNDKEKLSTTRAKLIKKIREIHRKPPELSVDDTGLLKRELALLQSSTRNVKSWLKSVTLAQKKERRTQQDQYRIRSMEQRMAILRHL